MKRALLRSPLFLHEISAILLLTFFLSGAKMLTPGEIVMQEGVAYRAEGRRLQEVGDLQRAASAYRRAIAVKPDYAEAYNDLGVVLESLGNLEQAEQAYKTALHLKPTLGSAHSNLALLYEGNQRVQEAAVHWGERVRLGPPEDSWVIAAREKLAKYQLAVPETDLERAQKKSTEIRLAIETGKAQMDARQWDKAIAQFERVLVLDPSNKESTRLLHLAQVRAEQDKGRQARELEAAKGRVRNEVGELQRNQVSPKVSSKKEISPKVELGKEQAQIKALEAAQIQAIKESRSQEAAVAKKSELARKADAEAKKQSARQLKELEGARRKAAAAELKAQRAKAKAEAAAASQNLRKAEKAKRQLEEAQRRAAEAQQRAEIARKAAEAARLEAEAASQTYQAAKPIAPKPVPAKPVAAKPVAAKPPPASPQEPAAASPDAQAIARQIAREKSQIRERTVQDLNRRAAVAMREARYQDGADLFKQILTLDPGNRNAKQGLERAQKALVKPAQ